MPEGNSSPTALPCDLLVFDLDGTLIDSRQDLANAVNATLVHLSRPKLADAHIASFVGDGATALLERSLEATAQPGEAIEPLLGIAMPFFLAFYGVHKLDFTYVYAGVLEELRKLHEVAPDMLMAVLTNKPYRPSRLICDGLGLSPYFFQNYGGDSFPQKKPHPMGMRALIAEASALSRSNIPPGRVVLVGDSHVDAETARAAGVRCLGCTYGLDTERLRAAQPDALAHAPSGWLSALQTMLA